MSNVTKTGTNDKTTELLEQVIENQEEILERLSQVEERIANLNLAGRDYDIEYDDESY